MINIVIGEPSHLFLYIYNKQIVDATEVRRAVETHRVRTGNCAHRSQLCVNLCTTMPATSLGYT
jgi:hypothetical protein